MITMVTFFYTTYLNLSFNLSIFRVLLKQRRTEMFSHAFFNMHGSIAPESELKTINTCDYSSVI